MPDFINQILKEGEVTIKWDWSSSLMLTAFFGFFMFIGVFLGVKAAK